MMSAQIDTLNDDDKRRGRDRRRFGTSMIYNYVQYSGPERRSRDDRRTIAKQRAQREAAVYAV